MKMNSRALQEIAADYLHLAADADGQVDRTRRKRHAQLLDLANNLKTMPLSHRFASPAAFATAWEKWYQGGKR